MRHPGFFTTVAILFTALGCKSDSQMRSYEVVVRNDSSKSVTVWLMKEGPPPEAGWMSPEYVATHGRGDEPFSGTVIPPGETQSTGNRAGEFMPNSVAVLRFYRGAPRFNQMLATNSGSPDRAQFDLTPGYNGFQVIDKYGDQAISRMSATPPPPTTQP
ncbi:MAG: hypothetical protein ACREJC_21500 [Tepidisphaeraceae bacterium]